jgi:uncharacterized membrane protein YfcA
VTALLLVAAGFAAGLSGSLAGLASLFSYPALLAVGLPPVTANVTNTVALTVTAVGSVANSRRELVGQGPTLRRLAAPVVLGGAAGAALLLLTPGDTFEVVVPVLVAGASVVLLAQPRVRAAAVRRAAARAAAEGCAGPDAGPPAADTASADTASADTAPADTAPADTASACPAPAHTAPWTVAALFAVAVYGGYFGAAAGVLMLALLLVALPVTLLQGNALKNLLLGLANATAAVGFALLGPVDWRAVPPMAAGLLVGSWLGPALARHLPATALRIGIAIAGLGLAVTLALRAW